MNRNEFENALMSTIVEYISDQIVLRYMDACKKAAVLFSGALIGYTDAVASLNELKKEGWELTVVMSKAAAEVLTEERIKNDIDPEAIFVEGAPVNGRQIIDDNQFVIIPALTINTAAKVANCISDNLLTNMISRAMATGKPIVAAIDGCCPDNEVRAKIGFKVTDAYKARMRSNLEAIQSYGINLTVDRNLCQKVNKVYTASFDFPVPGSDAKPEPKTTKEATTKPACGCMVAKTVESKSIRLDKKVIGRVDIAKNARYQTIVVGSDALVTGLASDEAYNRGITIIRE
ncbi:MAG: flavoprotein [Anaerobutyricum sp.]|nr:flavoprotein [Eubacterium sp.]MDY6046301.1 flavoprotein [Anaerobutyricum sp.]